MSNYWKEWTQKAGVRAVKTVAQSLLASVGTSEVLGQVDWKYTVSASVLAGILSVVTSVPGLPEVEAKKYE